MELHYENLVQAKQGYDYELAETVGEVRMRVRIHADTSYSYQSYAVGEVWVAGWVECATLLRGDWITWGKPSPGQDAHCKDAIFSASNELVARMAATLGL